MHRDPKHNEIAPCERRSQKEQVVVHRDPKHNKAFCERRSQEVGSYAPRPEDHNNFLLKALIRESDFLEDYKLAGAFAPRQWVNRVMAGHHYHVVKQIFYIPCKNSILGRIFHARKFFISDALTLESKKFVNRVNFYACAL